METPAQAPPTQAPPTQIVYVPVPSQPLVTRVRTNGFAIAGFVCSLVCIWGLGSVIGIVFGAIARNQIRDSEGQERGEGMAVAAIVIGILGLLATIGFFAFAFAVGSADSGY